MGESNAGRTVQEIMRLSPEQRRAEYEAVNLKKVIIDGIAFDNYGVYSFIWEKTYNESPKRSLGGSVGNIENHSTFLSGHLQINFSIMSIDYYRALMRLLYEKNEHIVECYDVVYDKWIKLKMYFATEEMPKLWTIAHKIQKSTQEWDEWIELVGVQEYTVELIGTNNDMQYISVVYHKNPPSDTGASDVPAGEVDLVKGDEILMGGAAGWQDETFGGKYKFVDWYENPEGTGFRYQDGYYYTVHQPLVLYSKWRKE